MDINFDALNLDDPCALLAILKPAYFRLISGSTEEEIQFEGERVRFSKGNAVHLKALIDQLERDCLAKSGKRRRYAATGSF